MAVDYNSAQALIQARGVQPPEGIQPGTPQYEQWATQWLKAAYDAGDPEAVKAAGGSWQGSSNGEWNSARGAKQGADWVGKRKPTPTELRKYSWDQGWGTDDYGDLSDAQLAAWIDQSWDVGKGGFYTSTGARVDKPTDSAGDGSWVSGWEYGGSNRNAMEAAGGGQPTGGGMGGSGGWGGNAQPTGLPEFTPPSYEDAKNDPGYQFALKEGLGAIEKSAAARGTLRTGGTLKDLTNYAQGLAGQQYQNVWNRAYQPWQTQYGGSLQSLLQGNQLGYNRWATQYGGNLQKYLQRENNIYGLLNNPYMGAY